MIQPKQTAGRKQLLSREQLVEMIEVYVSNPNIPLHMIANDFGISEQVVGYQLTKNFFFKKESEDTFRLILQSKINEE